MRSPNALLSLLLGLVLSGCVIHEHDRPAPQPLPGNVDFSWSFSDNNTCGSLVGFVDHIHITIDGEPLANSGFFPCQVAGSQGVQLQDFSPGSYAYTITAETQGGFVLYAATGSFVVNGDVAVIATLLPVQAAQPGDIALYWVFPNGGTCASQGIDHVIITIPGESLPNAGVFSCVNYDTNGNPVQGITLTNFAPRSYSITVDAFSGSYLEYEGTTGVSVNGNVQATASLQPLSGGSANLQLSWSFTDANQSVLGCSQAGVDTVAVTINGQSQGTFACTAGAQSFTMPSGQYDLEVDGLSGGNTLYAFHQSVAVAAPNTSLPVVLQPLYGEWQIDYNFSNAASCSVAGVTQISVSVKDASGAEISNAQGQLFPCVDAPNNYLHWTYFPGGAVTIQMYGYNASGQVIRGASRATNVPAGASSATTVTLDTCGTQNAGC